MQQKIAYTSSIDWLQQFKENLLTTISSDSCAFCMENMMFFNFLYQIRVGLELNVVQKEITKELID